MTDIRTKVERSEKGEFVAVVVELAFPSSVETIRFASKSALDEFLQYLQLWEGRIRHFAAAGQVAELRKIDQFIGVVPAAPQDWRKSVGVRTIRIASSFVAVFVAGSSIWLNSWRDDAISWEQAQAVGTARALRTYVKSHPNGRFLKSAIVAIDKVHVDSALRFAAQASTSRLPMAVKVVQAMIERARITGEERVPVVFLRSSKIHARGPAEWAPPAGKRVVPIGGSFDAQAMQRREERLVGHLRSALARIVPSDILNVYVVGSDSFQTGIVVRYSVDMTEQLYVLDTDKVKSEEERSYFPGISFYFDTELRAGDAELLCSFGFGAQPAEHFRVTHHADPGTDGMANSVYDAMADSAFEGFRTTLSEKMGIRLAADVTPT